MKPSLRPIVAFTQSIRLEGWLIILAAAAVAAASLFTYWEILADRDLTEATQFKIADSLAAAVEEQFDETLRDAHNAAYSAAILIENFGGLGSIDSARLHRELNREMVDNTSIARLIAADASGRVIASSAEYPLAALSIANSENFRWHEAHPADSGMHLGVTYTSSIDGRLSIPYSIAIHDTDGKLAGVVVAEIDIAHLNRFYQSMTHSFPATIAVVNREGIRLARYPEEKDLIGERISQKLSLDSLFQRQGFLEVTSAADDRRLLMAYRLLRPYLLAVAVGFDRESTMAPWVERSRQRAAVVGTGSVLFLALLGLFLVYLRRLECSEDRLRASEAQLRLIADNLPNGVVYQVERDNEGKMRFLYVSAGIERLTGLSANAVLKDATLLHDKIIKEDQPRVVAAEQASAESMSTLNIVVRLRRSDGELRWLHLCSAPRKLYDGRILRDGILIDITEQKQAEHALRMRQARIESIFRSAPVGIGEIVNRVFTMVNDRFCEILGYSAEELLGQSTRMLYLTDADWEDVGRKYNEQFRGAGVATFEARYRRKDGRIIDVLVGGSSIVRGDPYAGVTFTVMDVTEAKSARRSLDEAYEKLKMLSGMLLNAQETERRHLSGELHDEIGQALTAVKMKLHGLGKRIANGIAAQEDVASAIEIADIALSQVRDLSVNLRPPQLELLGLEATLQWLLNRQAELAGLRVHFNADLNAAARTAQADITCFRVAQEALTNVIRHAHATNLWVDVADGPEFIELHIKDDGIGFDPEATRARVARGGSIGLLSMEERVTLQGGAFELASRPNGGTEIRARIPLVLTYDTQIRATGEVG
jgi:PAS domain S-box-containing protein